MGADMNSIIKNTANFALTALAVAFVSIVFSSAAFAEKNYQPPRMPNGKPSLQGAWTNASITTLERSAKYAELIIPENQVQALTNAHPQVVRQNTDDNLDHANGLLDGSDLARGRGYNAFWIDPGKTFGLVKGTHRTSWIVDPVNGKIPLNANGNKWLQQLNQRRAKNFDGPEARPPAERCLIIGGRVGPPMVNGLYNNNYQIVQTDNHVAIWVEMVSHVRIIPLTKNKEEFNSHINPLFGESIGHWEGDTLIVETSHFSDLQMESPVPLSASAKVTERFSRVSEQQLLYEFAIDDPNLYSQIWKGEMSFMRQENGVFEYACHEGNYALEGILGGARYQEQQ